MRKGLTEIIFIVDRSASMSSIQKDMISGFNKFIEDQKKAPTECKVSFYQFDDYDPRVEMVYEQMALNFVPKLTTETFVPRGNTPLHEAVATVVRKTEKRIADSLDFDRPERVLVVTITDGQENSSIGWTKEQVSQLTEHKEKNDHWEFVYLGANQNAWDVGASLGVKSSSCLSYVASAGGTEAMFKSLSDKAIKYRTSADVSKGISFDEDDKMAQVKQGYSQS